MIYVKNIQKVNLGDTMENLVILQFPLFIIKVDRRRIFV